MMSPDLRFALKASDPALRMVLKRIHELERTVKRLAADVTRLQLEVSTLKQNEGKREKRLIQMEQNVLDYIL